MSGRPTLLWVTILAVAGVAFAVGRATAPSWVGTELPFDILFDPAEVAEPTGPRPGPMLHPAQRAQRPPPGEAAPPKVEPAPKEKVAVASEGDGDLVTVRDGTYKVVARGGKHVLVRHGDWTERHPDGSLKLEATYENGRPAGVYRSYHRGGRLKTEAHYEKGVLDGLFRRWHPNGQLMEEKTHRRGKPHGQERTWHPNGRLATLGSYEAGLKDGVWTSWDENGTKRSEASWRSGEVQGDIVLWDETGAVLTDEYAQQKATVNDKYHTLLRRVHSPKDKQSYGEFRDYGPYGATSYAGVKDIPAGFWVYVYPHWYIWAKRTDGKER